MMEKKEIEEKANAFLERYGDCREDEVVDVIKMARRAGFLVGNTVLDSDDDGFIIIKDGASSILGLNTDKLIGVNSERTLEWKRFIIAHELGHYVLHFSQSEQDGMYAHRDHGNGRSETENEADYFAANILMPTKMFTKKYEELKGKKLDLDDIIIVLSSKFKVNKKAVERRIDEIGEM